MYVNCRYFTMRRRREETLDEAGCSKKRCVEHATFLKRKRDLDREHQTLSWLECDSAVESGKKVVFKLRTLQGLYAIRREDKKQEEF